MAFMIRQGNSERLSTQSFMAELLGAAHNGVMKTRADRIRYLRTEVLGFENQDDLAEELGVTRGAVSNWEQGRGIKKAYLLRLAKLGNTSVEWIETGKGDAPADGRCVIAHIKSEDDSCVAAALEGMLRGFGLTDSQAVELRALLRKVLQEQISGQTEDEVRNTRKTLAQFVTSQFLQTRHLKDEEE